MSSATASAGLLEKIAFFDSSLNIPNREGCLQLMEKLFEDHKKKGFVLKLNLENFKLFNDTFGYDYGDILLKLITTYLCGLAKDKVYRFGGVEFIILLEGYSYGQATELAEKILERFDSTWKINDMDCICGVNIGMLGYPEHAGNTKELVERLRYVTDEAIYNGQNQMAVYDSAMEAKIARKHHIAKLIKDALHNDTLEIRYRPTYSLEEQRFCRAESYLRLISPEYGIIYSAEFLPIAEDAGLICAVNNYAIRKTCTFISRLLKLGCNFETIAVVISPVQFLQETFVEDVAQILKETNVPAQKLAFEITESVLINSYNTCNIVMQELSDMGVEFILNDFGTGYSGINNILSLPVDVLKLERLFVWQLETNPRSGYVIEGLISIANNLGMKIIAEGVETENQNELLKNYHCSYVQGFYYSPTIEDEMLVELLKRQ